MDDFLFQAILVIATLSFDSFTIYHWIAYSFLLFLGFKLADLSSSSKFFWHDVLHFDLIKSHNVLTDADLNFADFAYTTINRCITIPVYIYHSAEYYRHSANNIDMNVQLSHVLHPWNVCQIFIHFMLLFLIYDLFYVMFHRALHIRAIYPYIHKHHHRQVSPFRGTYDGVNNHPLENVVGTYLHLASIVLLGYLLQAVVASDRIHVLTICLFYLFSSLMASLNHTRYAVNIPGFYDVRDHDVHHRWPRSNYGQFVMYWDKVCGFYKSSQELDAKSN